ncbi:hypothetical protein SDC9_181328 [bioreactor metagenome]|uniref:Uncharacterized protein n=1 Tax=bioreactor metagenome TaxID=1076179 RepID=A0A645H5S2_9ZZZZ
MRLNAESIVGKTFRGKTFLLSSFPFPDKDVDLVSGGVADRDIDISDFLEIIMQFARGVLRIRRGIVVHNDHGIGFSFVEQRDSGGKTAPKQAKAQDSGSDSGHFAAPFWFF